MLCMARAYVESYKPDVKLSQKQLRTNIEPWLTLNTVLNAEESYKNENQINYWNYQSHICGVRRCRYHF